MKLALVTAFLIILSHSARAEEFSTKVDCGGVSSEIKSVCGNDFPICSKQEWVIGKRIVDLKKDQKDFDQSFWACLPDKNAEYKVVLWGGNTGNCEDCERLTIWSPNGDKLSGWKDFKKDYIQLGLPNAEGEAFHAQFHGIAKGADH